MTFDFLVPAHAPAAHVRRRFRIAIGVLAGIIALLLVFQYTPAHVLPPAKTTTLWGFLVGITGWGLLFDRSWAAAARRDQAG